MYVMPQTQNFCKNKTKISESCSDTSNNFIELCNAFSLRIKSELKPVDNGSEKFKECHFDFFVNFNPNLFLWH